MYPIIATPIRICFKDFGVRVNKYQAIIAAGIPAAILTHVGPCPLPILASL